MKNIAIRPTETKMMSVFLLLNGLRGSNPINELLLKKTKIFVDLVCCVSIGDKITFNSR
mgnify:CR=1 FL=1